MQVNELYAEITKRIMEGLAQGVKPWRKGWDADVSLALPRNGLTGQVYHGVNVLWLWCVRAERGFSCHTWVTYRQAQELAAQHALATGTDFVKNPGRRGRDYYTLPDGTPLGGVRRGAKAAHCVKYVVKDEADAEDGQDRTQRVIPCAFTVFNLDQIENVARHDPAPSWNKLEACEQLIARATAPGEIGLIEEGVQPYYSLLEDCIVMPRRARFADQHEYMVTFFHELAHAVGAPTRLNRQFGNDGTQARALEELVAELSSAFLAAHFGIESDHANHESYIDSWLALLDRDKSAVIRAARLAEQAVGFILERYGSVQ